jgi:integrase
MAKTTFRFWHRNDRPNKDGTAPIHLVYQIKGQRKYLAIADAKLFPVNWNADEQQAVYIEKKIARRLAPDIDVNSLLTASEAAKINAKLQEVRKDVADVETRFKLDKKVFSAAMIIDTYKTLKQPVTKKDEPGVKVVDFILKFVKDSAGTHSPGTLKVYSGLAKHLMDFEKSKSAKVTFENIDIAVLRAFHSFLSDLKHMNNITSAKQLSTLKTLLNYARTLYKVNIKTDYRDYKISRKDGDFEVITLTQDEFLAIYNMDLSENKRLDAVRDVFCFSCSTGLRFSDLCQLRQEHIRKDNTLRLTSAKTGQKLVIPLNTISYSILQKYTGKLKPLPVISNQKTNDYIKEIGQLAGINTPIEKVRTQGIKKVTRVFKKYEILSIHVGRKSFITLSLERGIAIQEVMSLSGHSTFKAFKRYVDVNDNRKKTVMADAWGKVENLKAI